MQTYHYIQDKMLSQKKNLKVYFKYYKYNFLEKKSLLRKTVCKFFTCIKSFFVIKSTVLLLILGTLFITGYKK